MKQILNLLQQIRTQSVVFWRKHWIGTIVILIATIAFFWPLIIHINNYSEGGDAMFNAWTLARDQHCILRQDCPNYADGNIYFPNKDSMLYSETQLSTALVSLPLHWIDPNPLLAYNVITIVSYFLAGWFMYLLAKRLSRNNELFSVLAGLVFAFAPTRLGISHLQNLCIFCLPLAVLFILKYFERHKRLYLAGLFVTLLYLFFASWYQMVFGIIAIGVLIGCALLMRLVHWKTALHIVVTVAVAAIMTLPLALQYTHFSKQQHANFGIGAQVTYAASVADYFLPYSNTLLGGYFYRHVSGVQVNAYNPDNASYGGLILYTVALGVAVMAYLHRKKRKTSTNNQLVVLFLAIAVVGFIVSLGPLLKVGGAYYYAEAEGYRLVIPLPYLIVDLLLPQLSFIRSIGRAAVLVLFGLGSLLALAPLYLQQLKISSRGKTIIVGVICLFIFVDVLPARPIHLLPEAYHYNLRIPAVYSFIKSHPQINNIIVLRADIDYPGAVLSTARLEDVLWAGYHNRNIFNGYSGFEPPTYKKDYADFVDFAPSDVAKMQHLGLRYVLVDKQLSTSNPTFVSTIDQTLKNKTYQDDRYALYELPVNQ